MDTKLTPRQERFVDEYLVDLNATAAAIRAGYAESGARTEGCRLLIHADVAAKIEERKAARVERLEISQDTVLRELLHHATADSNELIEWRVGACRNCWGKDNLYQRTKAEFERDKRAHEIEQAKAASSDSLVDDLAFDEQGGIGYSLKREPNPECEVCWGEGLGRTVVKDTRKLSAAARSLYAGVKQTKDGIEIKQNSKDKALEMLAKHKNLFKETVVHEHKFSQLEELRLARERAGISTESTAD